MLRRDFIRSLTSLLGLAAIPNLARAGQTKYRLIQQCPVAGFQYHQGDALWGLLNVGDSLELIRKPENPFDANAIRIAYNGHKLGYIPRNQNQATARMLDEGRQLYARVGNKTRHPNPWQRIGVEVWLVV
ncbi:MAG: HIRAN domain-containing protein [Betaproteobacteria bacterium]|nr:HIRAN domain-containing protein [Betaproteobacteria bacterium]